MMHEREKSDTAVVAAKPTNNAGASTAAAAEPGSQGRGPRGTRASKAHTGLWAGLV
jgi:hypothetical protein